MKIDLEKYIQANRDQLDNLEDINEDLMWADFNRRRNGGRRKKIGFYLAAAVAAILIGVNFLLSDSKNFSADEMIYEKLVEIDPHLAAEQVSMRQLIDQQDVLIDQMGIDKKQFPDLVQELENLDQLQLESINDLENYKDRKNLMRTLLRYYERKTRLLELMLYENEKQKNKSSYESATQI